MRFDAAGARIPGANQLTSSGNGSGEGVMKDQPDYVRLRLHRIHSTCFITRYPSDPSQKRSGRPRRLSYPAELPMSAPKQEGTD
jgi:hypothetical protein